MRSFRRYSAPVLWSIGALLLIGIVLLGKVQMPPIVLIAVALPFMLLPIVVGVGLAICYRAAWRSWPNWAVAAGAVAIAGVLSREPIPVGPFDLQGAATLLLIGIGTALVTAIGITLYHQDIALAVAAWLGLGLMWGAVVWWRLQGDFVLASLNALRTLSTTTSSIYWPSLVFTISLCLSPLLLASFVWHTIRLIIRERRRAPLPPP